MAFDDKLLERKLLLKRAFPRIELFDIGKELSIPYFASFASGWEIDEDEASIRIASNINEKQLKEIFDKHAPREWTLFRGAHYTFENGELRLEGSGKTIQTNVHQAKKRYGENCVAILKKLVKAGRGCSLGEIKKSLKRGVDPLPILAKLEQLKVIVTSYKGGQYQEWEIPEEVSPMVQMELGIMVREPPKMAVAPTIGVEEADYMLEERQKIRSMNKELDEYLNALLKRRLDATIKFGKTFSVASLASYLQDLFGPLLYFDTLLSITQQYGLADTEIVHEHGKTGMRTGWNLSLFGEPGTGKSFSTRDMILGKPDAKVFPHGIPGRNRYTGGMTPARFIRIGQAYVKRTFNFIIPEFNDWFKYRGMVEPLKLAMERGVIKYEMHREVVGPYRFNSFFSANYNVSTFGRGYEVTVQDPNFNAIEDRMLCRLHTLTKQRYVEIAQSQMRLAFGEIDIEKGARQIRDHLTLVYAIETEHPLVKGRFICKPVMINPQAYDLIKDARKAILEQIPQEFVRFSARLEDRAIRFACAASLLSYFHSDLDYIPVSEDALRYAVQLYVEEASVRSREEFKPEEVLGKLA
ncbi:MAG: hypothetical protein OEX76_04840 [Candidatus Bathyarchaeota archaeon]|nr:hypothetical protein [Candidatus Bathyarchaeota archaeon]MDH5532323.1 hypothetical protein [Candidatus Bathyarchaeota archaeon]